MKKRIITIIGILIVNVVTIAQNPKLKIGYNQITIPINTAFKISVEIKDGKLENFKLLNQTKVDKPADIINMFENVKKQDIISNEIEFSFCYGDFMGDKNIVLITINHLEKPITFKAKIKYKGTQKYKETSILDKYPNVLSIEQWQDEIESIILYDFKIVKNK